MRPTPLSPTSALLRFAMVVVALLGSPAWADAQATQALGLAVQAKAAAYPLATRAIGNVYTRILGGRMANVVTNSSDVTYETEVGIPIGFDAVRLIYAVGQAGGLNAQTPTLNAKITVPASPSDADLVLAQTGRGWTTVTFSSATTLALAPPAAANRTTYYLSDWMLLPSVARSDGGTAPLLTIRSHLTATPSNPIILMGDGSQSFTNWVSHPSGRTWRMRLKTGGDYTALAANPGSGGMDSTNSTTTSNSPLVGIQALVRGKVINLFGFGDSITEGQGTYIGEGFGFPAATALSANAAGVTYEWSNLGWSSGPMTYIRDRVTDALAAGFIGPSDIAVISSDSPNETGPPISANNILAGRGKLAQALAYLGAKQVPTIIWTWMPTNTAVRAYGSTDSLRRAYNVDIRAYAARGQVVADFDAALAGIDDGTGQIQFRAGTTTDGIHPNDAGNAVLAPILVRAVQKLAMPVSGSLVQ